MGHASQVVRSTIVLSAAAAIGVQLWLASQGWPALLWIGLASSLAGVIAGRRGSAAGYWLVLVPIYLYPVAVYLYADLQPFFSSVLLAGVLGLAIGAQPAWRWSLPRPWALALSFTALAIALTWPTIAVREMDFTFAQLFVTRQSVTWRGIPPHVHIAFLTGVAGAHLAGVLFLDAMAGRFREDYQGLRRLVLAPLAISAAVSSLVALYQMTMDITFLNDGMFASLDRASGMMRDANAFGAVAAIWAVGSVWLVAESPRRGRLVLSVSALALFTAAVWSTGSRTAMLAFVVALPFLGIALLLRFRSRLSARGVAAGLAASVVALGLVALVVSRSDVVGPLSRLGELESAGGSLSDIVKELRDRGGYGISARNIIADVPWTGTGVGTFHAMVLEYGMRHGLGWLPPDNAQNWFRHQVAELGWAGTAGYFVWMPLFIWFAAKRLIRGAAAVYPAGGALAGILAASLLGVPTQEVSVVMTFWVMAIWLCVAGRLPLPGVETWRTGLLWGAVALAAVLYAAGTAYVAVERLRVPARAAATGWSYEYGVSPFVYTPSSVFRWTERKAALVFAPGGKVLHLRMEVRHPDVARRPVEVVVEAAGSVVLRTRVRTGGMIEGYIPMPYGISWAQLELSVDRTFTDPESGAERGLLLHPFTFVNEAPIDTWRFR